MNTVLPVITCVLVFMWAPILVRFYRSWQERKNPVSLAICWMIVVVVYSHLLYTLVMSFGANPMWVGVVALIFSFVACVNFYGAFYWSNKKFKDQRSHHSE